MHVSAVARRGEALADDAAGTDLRADRRNRRRADDIASRTLGGDRNWDYRFCWLRDATLTLLALMDAGTSMRRGLAGLVAARGRRKPEQLQIMYGVAGERCLPSGRSMAARLRGLEAGSDRQRGARAIAARCVRRGDGRASSGARRRHRGSEDGMGLQQALSSSWRRIWEKPDWESGNSREAAALHALEDHGVGRGRPRRQERRAFQQLGGTAGSMARVARSHPRGGVRARLRRERDSFVQAYGSKSVDASLLLIPLVGFLPADDPRVLGTVGAVEAILSRRIRAALRQRGDRRWSAAR